MNVVREFSAQYSFGLAITRAEDELAILREQPCSGVIW